jgi:hypothetical protein
MKTEKITEEEVERLLTEHGFHTLARIIAEDLEKIEKKEKKK